jgi:hypothetical protein
MKLWRRAVGVGFLCAVMMTAFGAVALNNNATTTVPLHMVPVGGDDYKLGVTVSVAGGPPSQLTFDTGGVGLHIFASQVGNQNIRYTQQHIRSSFGGDANGFTFDGVIAYAPVTIGGVTTKPIPILVIQNVQCHGGGTSCGFNMSGGAPPMYGAFYGEFGAGMMPEIEPNSKIRLFSPLRDLPGNYSSGFIIEHLHPDVDGQLIIGLTPDNTNGFNRAPLKKFANRPDGQPVFDDKSLMVNYAVGNFQHTWRTAFDTGGNANVNIFGGHVPGIPVHPRNRQVIPGLNFAATLSNVFNWQFTTGNQEGVNVVKVLPRLGGRAPYVNTGLLFFFNYDVMYDFSGTLGFRPQN